jgi:hypothetical protein
MDSSANKKRGMQDPPFGTNSVEYFRLFFLAAAGSLFGCLEGVDLACIFNLDLNLYMACKIADSIVPFFCRRRIGAAYLANGAGNNALTPFTIFNHRLAGAIREYTALFAPKGTLGTWKYCLTLHASSS